jgi:hypothetical protein
MGDKTSVVFYGIILLLFRMSSSSNSRPPLTTLRFAARIKEPMACDCLTLRARSWFSSGNPAWYLWSGRSGLPDDVGTMYIPLYSMSLGQ